MDAVNLSSKGHALIELYQTMATVGYSTTVGKKIENAYNDFELCRFRHAVKPIFAKHQVTSVLDYGCGGSDWFNQNFFDGKCASDFFDVDTVFRYEPARDIDERKISDLVTCFDVLEHVHVLDLPSIIRDLFKFSRKALVINVACYNAAALLPTGENAHITVRPPAFWLGVFSSIAVEFPHVEVNLFCSKTYQDVVSFPAFSAVGWAKSEGFCT